MSNRITLPYLLVAAALLALLLAAPAATAAPAGPQLAKCGKLKGAAGKLDGKAKRAVLLRFRRCLAQNKANAIAFRLIRNGRYVGVRGDGEAEDWTFCASGKWEVRSSGSYGNSVNTGRRWRVANAKVVQNGKAFNAIIKGEEGLQLGLKRRGPRWFVGISSFEEVTEPGPAERSNAAGRCRTL